MQSNREPILLQVLLLCLVAIPSACDAKQVPDELVLEESLASEVGEVAKVLQAAGARTVGVLQYMIKTPEQETTRHDVGILNRRLTERTESALGFMLPRGTDNEMVCLLNATKVACEIEGASHLADPGTAAYNKLFAGEYPLAWKTSTGLTQAKPDAFVFGVATFDDEMRNLTIELHAIVRAELQQGLPGGQSSYVHAPFTAPVDLEELIAAGESFVVQPSQRRGVTSKETARQAVYQSRHDLTQEHPLNSPVRPIDFEVLFDGAKQPVSFSGSGASQQASARVPEPKAGQTIAFSIKRHDPSDENRYGILLCVNGVSTLLREQKSPEKATVWILRPDRKELRVTGFQMGFGTDAELEPFEVLSTQESRQRENIYQQDVGLITVTVFQEATTNSLVSDPADDETLLQTIENAVPLETTADNRSKWGSMMTSQRYAEASRGLIEGSDQLGTRTVNEVKFYRDPVPVFSASVRYYRPKSTVGN